MLSWRVGRVKITRIVEIGTHFAAPTAGHVVRDGAAFRFEV